MSASCPIKILIVDDHPLFRQGLVDVLTMEDDLDVVAQAADGEAALAFARQHRPDVVLMDINLPNTNGLQVTRRLIAELPGTKVVILTGYDEVEQIYHALAVGAGAYATKDIPPDNLLNIIRTVYQGRYVINDQVMDYEDVMAWAGDNIERYAGEAGNYEAVPYTPLSPREMEILELVTRGSSNKEIANKLTISQQTVKNHMTAILRKLRVDDRTQAAVFALRHGWVRMDASS